MASISVLDLPEPVRSETLAEMGMTAEEYAAFDAGRSAAEAEEERMFESGERQRASDMHYDDDLPGVRVVRLKK